MEAPSLWDRRTRWAQTSPAVPSLHPSVALRGRRRGLPLEPIYGAPRDQPYSREAAGSFEAVGVQPTIDKLNANVQEVGCFGCSKINLLGVHTGSNLPRGLPPIISQEQR